MKRFLSFSRVLSLFVYVVQAGLVGYVFIKEFIFQSSKIVIGSQGFELTKRYEGVNLKYAVIILVPLSMLALAVFMVVKYGKMNKLNIQLTCFVWAFVNLIAFILVPQRYYLTSLHLFWQKVFNVSLLDLCVCAFVLVLLVTAGHLFQRKEQS